MSLNLEALEHKSRLLFDIPLKPIQGERFQPTGFPNLGAATFASSKGQCLLVESAQSMANRLESTIWDTAKTDLIDGATGLSYVSVADKDGRFLASSILEAHRLNSVYIEHADGGAFHAKVAAACKFNEKAPIDRGAFLRAVAKYDINSLVHGAFLKSIGGRLRVARAISSFIEADGVRVAPSGGVKNDHVTPGKEEGKDAAAGYGNVPFSRDEYTADRITLYVNIAWHGGFSGEILWLCQEESFQEGCRRQPGFGRALNMVTLGFRFPAGRYHATPWGHQVNEGLVEWPPSPWRLLRALVSSGYTRLGWQKAPPAAAKALLESLCSMLPSYHVPAASIAHTRHYMPTAQLQTGKQLEATTLVLDTWGNVAGGELQVTWDVAFSEEQHGLLGPLVERMNYLGRSESWVVGRVVPDTESRLAPNVIPHQSGTPLERGEELVSLMALVTPENYAAWRAPKRPCGPRALVGRDGLLPASAGSRGWASTDLRERRQGGASRRYGWTRNAGEHDELANGARTVRRALATLDQRDPMRRAAIHQEIRSAQHGGPGPSRAGFAWPSRTGEREGGAGARARRASRSAWVAISLFRYFAISLFRYFAISLFRYFAISLFRYFAISLFRYFAISLFRYFAISSGAALEAAGLHPRTWAGTSNSSSARSSRVRSASATAATSGSA